MCIYKIHIAIKNAGKFIIMVTSENQITNNFYSFGVFAFMYFLNFL